MDKRIAGLRNKAQIHNTFSGNKLSRPLDQKIEPVCVPTLVLISATALSAEWGELNRAQTSHMDDTCAWSTEPLTDLLTAAFQLDTRWHQQQWLTMECGCDARRWLHLCRADESNILWEEG